MHVIRDRRNKIAHEGDSATWSELDDAILKVKTESEHLGFSVPTPKYEFFFERGAMEGSTNPEIAFEGRAADSLRVEGETIVEVSWRESVHRS